jgi:ATP-dependent helicase HepA
VEGERYKIEHFYSPWKKQTVSQNAYGITAYDLPMKTRVYVCLEDGWKAGQITAMYRTRTYGGGNEYDVNFNHRPSIRLNEKYVFSRCWDGYDDPTLSLAARGVENQYWHERRHRFTASLLEQRAAAGGLGALLSSAIRFVPHQIDVVRRVLEDPLQRYLLADEVGMGKTIEAGLIIRQFLLLVSNGQVWVVAPQHLLAQWKKELRIKFYIDSFPNQVRFFSPAQFGTLPDKPPGLLVVDEAHHVVSHEIHADLRWAAASAPRLLLLSATPALGRSEILLRLLRLIDPDCYADVSLEAFQAQVDQRESIGIFLRGLRADASPVLIKQRLRTLSTLLEHDAQALQLGEQIAAAIAATDVDETRRMVNLLRGHVADVHRINQRLIRTRRRDAVQWAFRQRGPVPQDNEAPDVAHVHCAYVYDDRALGTLDLFEQWRNETAAAIDQGAGAAEAVIPWLGTLFEAFAIDMHAFGTVVATLPDAIMSPTWKAEFRSVLTLASPSETRFSQVAARIEEFFHHVGSVGQTATPRIVVFGSDVNDVRCCALALSERMGVQHVMLAAELKEGDDIAAVFGANAAVNFLFCSPAEEEGLNLHFMDAIVHLDLPLSPMRIEQRIGRLDRFGRQAGHLEQQIILPTLPLELNYWQAWHEILVSAFHIFNQPITDVLFSLEEVIADVMRTMLLDGTPGLRNSILRFQETLRKERDRLDDQHALDKVLLEQQGQADVCSALIRVDEKHADIRAATLDWMVKCLGFQSSGDHMKIFDLQWSEQRIQLPATPWTSIFAKSLNTKLTFKRYLALKDGLKMPPQIVRFGSQVMKQLELQCRLEDRGTAFATWRCLPQIDDDLWLGFKLCYIVEARVPAGLRVEEQQSLRARMDSYLAPWIQTFFVDAELQIVTDPERLGMLDRSYDEDMDISLVRRPQLFDHLMGRTQFVELCKKVRERSEAWLRNDTSYRQAIDSAVEKGGLDIRRRINRLKQRKTNRANRGEPIDSGLDREIELNDRLLVALSDPVVRLDAIGLIALSNLSPEEFTGQ